MRIVSWNLGHQTQERKIHRDFLEAVKLLSPDVLVLNEYVDGKSRTGMKAGLAQLGLATIHVSVPVTGQNQVLIASRSPQYVGDLTAPETTDAAKANFLHVMRPDIEIVGMRVPMFKTSELRAAYWNDLENLIQGITERRIVFIGDMNCNPDRDAKASDEKAWEPGDLLLKRLRIGRWHVPSPGGEWSFISKNGEIKRRLDHVIASAALTIVTAKYVTEETGIIFAGKTSDEAISDHAALVVEVSSTFSPSSKP